MLSRIVLRLIKEALFPAILIIVAKVGALLMFAHAFSLAWNVSIMSLIPNFAFENQDVSVFVNSYSNLVTFIAVLIGFLWVLTRAYHFHDTHVKPSLVLQLLTWNLTGLLTDSHEIYHKGVVWASYVWLVTLMIGLHTALGVNYIWIFVFAFVSSLLATWYFIADVERELIRDENTD